MPLSPGVRLGAYEIVAAIGSGGMGEVYRARDTRLHRDVAIKILPAHFAADSDRVARFQREAQVLASLNHPNIAQIHGLEETGGSKALVLELVDGPTLADVTAKGPIPVDEALPIARQIADALEAAHDNGIIHRDLKPANIKLTGDGTVKVLDFGLAKALDGHGGSAAHDPTHVMTQSPTITSPAMATHAGIILGTAVYMSPEQAKGRPADKRSDVWSFGCVLYEMLTGKRAFDGEDLTDVIAAVVRSDPDWKALPAGLPDNVRTLVKGCLEKDRKARIGDIAVARFLLSSDGAAAGPAAKAETRTGAAPIGTRRWLVWAAGTVAIAAATAAVTWLASNRIPVPSSPARLMVETGSDAGLITAPGPSAILSPDATVLAFVANENLGSVFSLYVRRLNQLQASKLAGTEGALSPFFSPDGSSIGFFAQGKLKRIAITGGSPTTLCDAPNGRGGTWSDDGWIFFAPESAPGKGIHRVPAEGGKPEEIIKLVDKETTQRWPHALPGGQTVIFTSPSAIGTFETASIVAYTVSSGTRKVLVQGGYDARYLQSGHLVFMQGATLFAAPFDVKTLELTGRPVPVIEGVSALPAAGSAQYAASANGTMVYVPGEAIANKTSIRWIDRGGKVEPLRGVISDWSNPSFAPDGRRLALDVYDGSQSDLWVYEWARDTLSRLTFDSGDDQRPVWSPGGRYIAFMSRRGNSPSFNLYIQRSDGTGEVQRLTDSANFQYATSWHPSGKFLAYSEQFPGKGTDLMILPLEGDEQTGWKAGKPQVFVSTPLTESSGMFSPDGRWVAYISTESGRNEIYVRPFPGPGGKWQISTAGGDDPTWSLTSSELIFLSTSDSRLMSASYRVDGESFQADKPVVLIDTRLATRPRAPSRDLDIHPDGKRFAVATGDEQQKNAQNRVVLILNFFDELRRIAPPTR